MKRLGVGGRVHRAGELDGIWSWEFGKTLSSVLSVLTLRLPLRNLRFVKDRFRCVDVDL